MNRGVSGFTLIEILVVAAISTIVMYAVASMLVFFNREVRSIQEKAAGNEAGNILARVLSDQAVCTYILADPAYSPSNPRTFDSSMIGGSTPPVLSLSEIFAGSVGNPTTEPSKVVFNVGGVAVAGTSSLVVQAIQLKNFTNTSPNQYTASFELQFNPTTLIRPVSPARYLVNLSTTGSGASTTITGCAVLPTPPLPRAWSCETGGSSCSVTVPGSPNRYLVTVYGYCGSGTFQSNMVDFRIDSVTFRTASQTSDSTWGTRVSLSAVVPSSLSSRVFSVVSYAYTGGWCTTVGANLVAVEVL